MGRCGKSFVDNCVMNRNEQLEKLKSTTAFDVIIIGGGATGLGCAVDAASRGLNTLLVEKYDFAKGTSSRATKLVHGGVRYLEQGNVRLVREALLERGRLLKNAAHVCHTLPFVVPSYNSFGKYYYAFGLGIYEFLSGKLSLGKTKLLSKAATLQRLPSISPTNLKGGILYYDGQFDDSRLAINLAKTAEEQGATIINYMAVTGFKNAGGKIEKIFLKDALSDAAFEVNGKVIINATGVFADEVLKMADATQEQTISPSQGVHIVIDKTYFKGDTGLMIPKTDDGRVLFAIPWHDKIVVGTTDTPVQSVVAEPTAQENEVQFIIDHFNKYTGANISRADVESIFTGLRPLAKQTGVKKTAVLPRDHVVKVLASGLIHITGGKWTTYRSMAEHTVNKAFEVGGWQKKSCVTQKLSVHGNFSDGKKLGNDVYGTDRILIDELIRQKKELGQLIHPKFKVTKGEVVFAIQQEMAMTIEDILARRARILFLNAAAAIEAAPTVADLFIEYAGKDECWKEQQLKDFAEVAQYYLPYNNPK